MSATPLPSMMQAARALVTRDLQLLWRRRGDSLQPVLFALLIVALFALALGARPQLLAQSASAVMWLAVLLAGLLSLDTLLRSDAEDGSLEQWLLAPVPLAWLVLVRVLVHWLTTALPLIAVAPLLGELLHLAPEVRGVLLVALALATPLLSLIGAICVAMWLAGHPIRDHAGVIMLGFVALFGAFTTLFGLSTLTWLSIVALIAVGAGQGIIMTPLLNLVLGFVRQSQAGMAAGVVSTVQQVGAALGVAAVGILFGATLADGVAAARADLYVSAFVAGMLYNLGAALLVCVLLRMLASIQREAGR